MRSRLRQLRTSLRHVERTLSELPWEGVTDVRSASGRRYLSTALLNALTVGLMTSSRTLRDVEELLAALPGRVRRRLGLAGTPSDTTLYRKCMALVPPELMNVLVRQVRQMWRDRQLEPVPGLPLHLVSIDGKATAKNAEGTHPEVQMHRNRKGGPKTWCLMALRAVHVSSAVKPALGQMIIPAGTGESRSVVAFARMLRQAYGPLVECVFIDAGLSGSANRMALAVMCINYIAGLKGNHGALYRHARWLLGKDEQEPKGGWRHVSKEKRNGKVVTRFFGRVAENGFAHCDNYRQLWRVRQVTVDKDGASTSEDRYFVTSLTWERLADAECLAAIRAHWGIENDCNWTLDVQWLEDSASWAWQGQALEALGVLRLIAYNATRLLRNRKLKSETGRLMPYRSVFNLVRDALVALYPPDPAPS